MEGDWKRVMLRREKEEPIKWTHQKEREKRWVAFNYGVRGLIEALRREKCRKVRSCRKRGVCASQGNDNEKNSLNLEGSNKLRAKKSTFLLRRAPGSGENGPKREPEEFETGGDRDKIVGRPRLKGTGHSTSIVSESRKKKSQYTRGELRERAPRRRG